MEHTKRTTLSTLLLAGTLLTCAGLVSGWWTKRAFSIRTQLRYCDQKRRRRTQSWGGC